ncbi:MAG: aromatic ring-hydroxylating dioxygenase subunit alpha [Iphinoe sp. HA4291-MV1]|jgi:phenylpropionate dioxygenase-like ring-hydroxylating dioxygenase large terminal subunit|nr:aromatic ring-hydroxylating dioxygenase subunit alpha [Iphinoe sp. HA4291-MV1]
MTSRIEKVQQAKQTQLKTETAQKAMNLAASWYVAMQSEDLGEKPKSIKLFGQSLVAWRDKKSQPVIMESYCSHKGASLTIGNIVDGCIQCPFHHWRYNSSGQCVYLPDVEQIPPVARQFTYITVEKYGYIWVWYGSKTPLFPLPTFSPMEEEKRNYMPAYLSTETNTTVRQVIENALDYYHLNTVHNLKFSDSLKVNIVEHQQSRQDTALLPYQETCLSGFYKFKITGRENILGVLSKALGSKMELSTVEFNAWASGLFSTFSTDKDVLFQELSAITPVAENKTILRRLIAVKKTGNFLLDKFSRAFVPWLQNATFAEDVPILSDINPDAGIAHIHHDWLLLKFRKFYQSWVDKVE